MTRSVAFIMVRSLRQRRVFRVGMPMSLFKSSKSTDVLDSLRGLVATSRNLRTSWDWMLMLESISRSSKYTRIEPLTIYEHAI